MEASLAQRTPRPEETMPYRLREAGRAWWLFVIILTALIGWAIFAYTRQFTEGLVVTGMRDIGSGAGAAWGLYIAFDIYFVGVSFAGITTAALVRLLNLRHLRPLSRAAETLTVISLPLAALVVVIDLGQPERGLIYLLQYARPQSPFFGTLTLVISGYLFASLMFLYLAGRRDAAICAKHPSRLQWFYRLWATGYQDKVDERERHSSVSWWLALAILPLLIVAHSTLGAIFGIQAGRPGWFSALQAPGFVIMAGVSGIGFLIIIAAILRRTLNLGAQITLDAFRFLGNMLWVLTAAYLYFLIVELLTANYAAPAHETAVSRALLTGQYAGVFWLSVAFLVIPFFILLLQFLTRRYSVGLMVLAGAMVNIAAIGKRFLIVVPSQTNGTILPYIPGSYTPTWVEYSIIVGLFALGALLYAVFVKVFPIVEISEN
ncbi:MAG: polysulfide reductase NrfD [Chloroflexi bacterium]|nr:polysulfide reductase NrfD [Chloroflexota bacterium]